jgi:flavin reductase (DIM6/NTAB) family NADH-FMN oxidoreductase RutF
MGKAATDHTGYLHETISALSDPGCLLVSQGEDGKPNVMTIGWGTIGIIWGRPMFVVLVRHSRYTWRLLEETDEFTVNVPGPELAQAAVLCGTKSGRGLDKFAEAGLTPAPGQHVGVPIIQECVVHYECRTVHRNNVDPTHLAGTILNECYGAGDFHTIYYGHILGVLADQDARERLGA